MFSFLRKLHGIQRAMINIPEFFKRVRVLKETGVKISLALGGWYDSQESKYSRLVNSRAARTQFIKHAVKFLKEHDFDGLEIDWEYPKCWQVLFFYFQ